MLYEPERSVESDFRFRLSHSLRAWPRTPSNRILHFLFILSLVFGFGLRVSGETIDQRNFAIDTYYPTPNEIHLAEQRAQKYWAKNAMRYGANPVYLAVETSKIFESEIVQNLWPISRQGLDS